MAIELSPRLAANFATQIYTVNGGNKVALKLFLKRREFDQTDIKLLKGDIGGRIFRATKDGFGLCAKGGGTYKGDLFLIKTW
jgi:hypothetical protein